MSVAALRTPDERFGALAGFPYRAHYVEDLPRYEGLRAAYVDEGPRDAEHVFLCLHGEPTWGYLYRRMIPVFLESGGRVVAPDLFGFGRSDKPTDEGTYSFHFHRNFLLALAERLDLRNVTLVVQDWGGLLGLTLPVDAGFQPRLGRLIVMNTTLAVGAPPSEGFLAWRAYAASKPDLPVGALLRRAAPHLSDAEVSAYEAPFPDFASKAGARAFPKLVMTEPDMPGVQESRAAVRFWSETWSGPSFMAIGAADPVLGLEVMRTLRLQIRGCPEPLIIPEGGHFVQEWGEPIARAALASFASAAAS
ncbi:MAG: haloalkane dehalogenase [Pseudomonadota bacterium]|jgi:pimeloyl-ACP methyl ester carboxylesterase